MKGFQPDGNELKIQAGVKRLLPAFKRSDFEAITKGLQVLVDRYGREIANASLSQIIADHPEFCTIVMNQLPEDFRIEFNAKAVEIMADVISKAGLRLEDHLRVIDEGIVITKAAVQVFEADGFPMSAFGEGQDSLTGIGINRTDGFVHPLSEAFPLDEHMSEEGLNSWAVASMVISGALGWTEASKEKCVEFAQECVKISAPTLDLQIMLQRSRYDDRALLRLCSLVNSGFDIKARKATGSL